MVVLFEPRTQMNAIDANQKRFTRTVQYIQYLHGHIRQRSRNREKTMPFEGIYVTAVHCVANGRYPRREVNEARGPHTCSRPCVVVVVVVVVGFTLNCSFYPTTSAVPPVSFLILHPGEIQLLWSQTVRHRKTKRR